jgi:hypothetical protein
MHLVFNAIDADPLFCSSDGVHFGLTSAQFSSLRSRSEGFRNLLEDASPPSSAATGEFPSASLAAPSPSHPVALAESSSTLADLFSFVAEQDMLPDLSEASLARISVLLEAADKYIFRVEAHLLRSFLR